MCGRGSQHAWGCDNPKTQYFSGRGKQRTCPRHDTALNATRGGFVFTRACCGRIDYRLHLYILLLIAHSCIAANRFNLLYLGVRQWQDSFGAYKPDEFTYVRSLSAFACLRVRVRVCACVYMCLPSQVLAMAVTVWLARWSRQSEEEQQKTYYVVVLALFAVTAVIISLMRAILAFYCLVKVCFGAYAMDVCTPYSSSTVGGRECGVAR